MHCPRKVTFKVETGEQGFFGKLAEVSARIKGFSWLVIKE
jgi:hypothetical protein